MSDVKSILLTTQGLATQLVVVFVVIVVAVTVPHTLI